MRLNCGSVKRTTSARASLVTGRRIDLNVADSIEFHKESFSFFKDLGWWEKPPRPGIDGRAHVLHYDSVIQNERPVHSRFSCSLHTGSPSNSSRLRGLNKGSNRLFFRDRYTPQWEICFAKQVVKPVHPFFACPHPHELSTLLPCPRPPPRNALTLVSKTASIYSRKGTLESECQVPNKLFTLALPTSPRHVTPTRCYT